MSVEIVREPKESPLSQKLNMGDVLKISDEADGDFSIVVLKINDHGDLMIFDLDDLGNRWSNTIVITVRDVVDIFYQFDTVTSIEYFRQPQIDVKITVGNSVKVL